MFSPTSAWSDLPLAPDEKTPHRHTHLPHSMLPPVPNPVGSRSKLAESLAATLASPRAGCGALLIGGPGTGKTSLARDVLHRLHGEVHIEYLRGSPAVERLPYGALNVLLAEVPEAELGHPLAVLRSVASFLQRRSGGKPVLLVVDNAHQIDPRAAAVMTAMADGGARLLVCADDARRTPAGLLRLWKDGRLARIDLAGFGVDDTAEWLGAALGPGLTLLAVQAIHEASAGNPLLLRTLTREWVESGWLVRRGEGWILQERPEQEHPEQERPEQKHPAPGCPALAAPECSASAAPVGMNPELAVLAAAERAVFDGRYLDVPADVEELLQSRDPAVQLRAAAVLCEALAATGNETDALELAAELLGPDHMGHMGHMGGLSQPDGLARGTTDPTGSPALRASSPALRASGVARGLRLLPRQRMWDGFGRLFAAATTSRPDYLGSAPPAGHAGTWLWIEMAEALANADAGLSGEALAKLRPVLAQLQAGRAEDGLDALAAAATAYACALSGDSEGARTQLGRLPAVVLHAGPSDVSWQQQVWIRYLGAMASAAAGTRVRPGAGTRSLPGNRAEATSRLLEYAAQANIRGALADELLFVSGAARLGATGSAARLATIAGQVQGDFARLCELFGDGIANGDAGMLFAAADLAEAQENRVFAQEAARAGLTIAARQHDSSLMRSTHSFILAERRLRDFAPGSGGTHDALSGREREIASLAATGASNAVIAHRLHVSIRTVEGHLQQIYRKLQVGPPAVPAGAFA